MFNKKATKVTYSLMHLLNLSESHISFSPIYDIILNLLQDTYLQGRKDQVDKVVFKLNENGSIIDPSG